MAAQKGPLASERIVAVLDKLADDWPLNKKPGLKERMVARVWANRLRIAERIRGYRANMSHNRADFLRHRYPDISKEDIRSRVDRFSQLLGYAGEIKVDTFAKQFYRIST